MLVHFFGYWACALQTRGLQPRLFFLLNLSLGSIVGLSAGGAEAVPRRADLGAVGLSVRGT